MVSFVIRPAELSDLSRIVDFNRYLCEETEGKSLDRSIVEQGVAALLEDSEKGRYFLAESGTGECIGQIMITYEWSDWRNGFFWWLQSVYVTAECRKQGVFSALLTEISKRAEADSGVCGIRLYVDKNNSPAQATYRARGFEHANYELMEVVFAQ